jgi:hypothetical protein
MPVHHVGDVAGWLCLKSPEMLLDRVSTSAVAGGSKPFVLPRVNAVDRTDVHARSVFRADARFTDDVGHGTD